MSESDETTDQGNKELRKQVRVLERQVRQLERSRATQERMARISKHTLLGVQRELEESVNSLQVAMQELTEARNRAEEALEVKGRFLATMSHELRTPMNGVLGAAHLLRECGLSDDDEELVDLIESCGRGLMELINGILDFSKIEAGSMLLEAIPFDVQHCVSEVVQLQALTLEDKPVNVSYFFEEGLRTMVIGDPTRLRQVLMNLVSNAIKFTQEGEVVVSIESDCSDPGFLAFSVHDTGIGIEEDALTHIFEAFTQADGSTTRRFGGTGLGLAICSQLVHLMGGELAVASEVGVGSVFTFEARLPPAADDTAQLDVGQAA